MILLNLIPLCLPKFNKAIHREHFPYSVSGASPGPWGTGAAPRLSHLRVFAGHILPCSGERTCLPFELLHVLFSSWQSQGEKQQVSLWHSRSQVEKVIYSNHLFFSLKAHTSAGLIVTNTKFRRMREMIHLPLTQAPGSFWNSSIFKRHTPFLFWDTAFEIHFKITASKWAGKGVVKYAGWCHWRQEKLRAFCICTTQSSCRSHPRPWSRATALIWFIRLDLRFWLHHQLFVKSRTCHFAMRGFIFCTVKTGRCCASLFLQ